MVTKHSELPWLDDLPSGRFYECEEREVLFHGDPEEALHDHIQEALEVDFTEAHIIGAARALSPIRITAYNPLKLSERFSDSIVDDFFELVDERLHDNECGDPEGDHVFFDQDTQQQYRPVFRALVRSLLSQAEIWACEPTGHVELDADAVEQWVRNRSGLLK